MEDPEAEEWKEFVALVVKAVVFAGLDDAEEEKARETEAPEHDEDGVDDLAGMMSATHSQGKDGEEDEVGSSREVWSYC